MKRLLGVTALVTMMTPVSAGDYGYGYQSYSPGVYMEKRMYVNGYPAPGIRPPPPVIRRPPPRCCGPRVRPPRPFYYQEAPQNQINIGGDNFGGASIINQN